MSNKKQILQPAAIPESIKDDIKTKLLELENLIDMLRSYYPESDYKNMVGMGFRNTGFIEGCLKSFANNKNIIGTLHELNSFEQIFEDYLYVRDTLETLNGLRAAVQACLSISGNASFNAALIYYGNVQTIARRTKDEPIMSIYQHLKSFFKRTKRSNDKLSKKQIEHDAQSLIHGQKDGEIIIKNEQPQIVAGNKLIIDNIQK